MGHKVTDRMAWRGIVVETRQKRGARTTGDDGFEVDDRVGEGGAVEGLAGYLECREEEWCGHRRKRTVALLYAVGCALYDSSGFGKPQTHRVCHVARAIFLRPSPPTLNSTKSSSMSAMNSEGCVKGTLLLPDYRSY